MSGKRVCALICLVGVTALAAFTGCGRDSDPSGPEATGSLSVVPGPGDVSASWTLTGPDGFSAEGTDLREFTRMPVGSYTLTWHGAEGWVRPWPDVVTRDLESGGVVVYQGDYRENVPSTVSIDAGPAAVGATWTLRGQEGLTASGSGDRVFENVDAGHYELLWDVPAGWLNAGPVVDEGEVFGQELAFSGEFVTDVDTPAGWEYVPAGTFTMGSPISEWGRQADELAHEVTLSRGFMAAVREVTLKQYRDAAQWAYENGYVAIDTSINVTATGEWDTTHTVSDLASGVMIIQMPVTNLYVGVASPAPGDPAELRFLDPSIHDTDNAQLPVKGINWYGAAAYCNWLSLQEGLTPAYDAAWACNDGDPYGADGYRLPTEAEWERACRAGAATAFASGPVVNPICNDPNLNVLGWHCQQGLMRTMALAANAWGLFDLHGNVWEWTQDWYEAYPEGPVTDPGTESAGLTAAALADRSAWIVADAPVGDGAEKVDEPVKSVRGGAFSSFAVQCRSANRSFYDPYWVSGQLGFRPVRTLVDEE